MLGFSCFSKYWNEMKYLLMVSWFYFNSWKLLYDSISFHLVFRWTIWKLVLNCISELTLVCCIVIVIVELVSFFCEIVQCEKQMEEGIDQWAYWMAGISIDIKRLRQQPEIKFIALKLIVKGIQHSNVKLVNCASDSVVVEWKSDPTENMSLNSSIE